MRLGHTQRYRIVGQGTPVAALLLSLLAACSACTDNGEKPTPSDDDTKPACSASADCGAGKTCNYLGECVLVSVSDDDDKPANDDDADTPDDNNDDLTGDNSVPATFPYMYEKYSDIPPEAWEPRPGCESPDSPIVRLKFTPPPRDQFETPDVWPFNDPSVLWVDEITPSNSIISLNHDQLAWSVAIDMGLDVGRPEYRCETARVLRRETHEAFEYACRPDGYEYRHATMIGDNLHLLLRRDSKRMEPPVNVVAKQSDDCSQSLYPPDEHKTAKGVIDGVDGKAVLVLEDSSIGKFAWHHFDFERNSLTLIDRPDISQGDHSIRGNYLALLGRDSATATPDVLLSAWLYRLSDGELKEVFRPRVNPDVKFECNVYFTKTNGEYVTWTNACKTEPRRYVSLYHIPTSTLIQNFHAGTLSRLNKYTLFVLYSPVPEDNADGAGLLAIDLESGRQKYLTKNGWPTVAPEVDGKWVAFKIDGWGVFLWDLEKAGFTDAEGRLKQ